jgi:hypothetical protein
VGFRTVAHLKGVQNTIELAKGITWGHRAQEGVGCTTTRRCSMGSWSCAVLHVRFCRYRFKFQSNLVWDSIKSISNFCFQF